MPRKAKETKHKGVFEKVKGSGIWWILYYDASGNRRRESVGTFGNAVKLYEQKKAEIRAGVVVPMVTRRGSRFRDLVEDAKVYYKAHHRDSKNFAQRIDLALPEFGDRIADTITGQQMQAWMDAMSAERGWSGGTRNAIKASLSTVFREAIRTGKASSNPMRLVRRSRESQRIRYLTEDEEARLRRVMGPDHHGLAPLDVALYTGMRKSEQFTVTPDQVDLRQKQIFLDLTKNGSSRYVQLNSAAFAVVEKLLEEHKRLGLSADTPIFLSKREGKSLSNPRKWFETALKAAKIEGVTWHTLRHTFASRLVTRGVDLKTVQELMGHKTIAMTFRYAHLAPSHKAAALEVLVPKAVKPERQHSRYRTATKTATWSRKDATTTAAKI